LPESINEQIIKGMDMKEQFEKAKIIIDDIVFNHIFEMEDIYGECEDRRSIEEALKLLFDLAEKSVK
jgi:hypothetical protein